MLTDLFYRLRSLLHFKSVEKDLDEELQFHLEQQAEKYRQAGLTRDEALRCQRIAFGGVGQVKDACRDARGTGFIETLAHDLRHGWRILRKSPGFTAVTLITLAAGIGANTAIFSVVDSVLLRPLPFKSPNRLVDITEYSPGKVDSTGVPYPSYLEWKRGATAFDETAAYFLVRASNDIVLGSASSVERARYSVVTNSFFTILGTQPALGQGFIASDELPGAPKAFLISDALWRGSFGANPRAIGRSYLLDGESYTLRGVMPPQFDFPKGCGVWLPIGALGQFGIHDRVSHPFHVLGRLRSGVSLATAQAQIEGIQQQLGEMYPDTGKGWHVRAMPLLEEVTGNVQTSLFVLLGAVGFILLIACTNVVNLMLARASTREREFAIRAALGAGRMRLLRQNLTEAGLIVFFSTLLSVALARFGIALAVSLTSIQIPRMESFQLSLPVLAFTAAIATLTTIVVGLAPSLQGSGEYVQIALRNGRRLGGLVPTSQKLRDGLVICQVTLALILLCGAGLMLRSFVELSRVDPGFETEHLVTMKVALPGAAYPRAAQTKAFFDRLLERLHSLPGIEDAALTSAVPLNGETDWGSFQIAGRENSQTMRPYAADSRSISANYFQTLDIPILRGRTFAAADSGGNAIVINQAMAKKFWPAINPIGQRLIPVGDPTHSLEIIGVVADVRSFGLDVPSKPEMYTLYRGAWYMNLVLRTSQRPATLVPFVRAAVAALDKGVPIYQIATMDQLISSSIAPQRFETFLLTLFAILALTLAAVGL